MIEETGYCSDIARDHQLSLAGTATQGKVWFLLEYPAAWDSKAFDACNIPEEVKAHLTSAVEGVRILLIRQSGRPARMGCTSLSGSPTRRPRGCMSTRSGRMPTCWRSI